MKRPLSLAIVALMLASASAVAGPSGQNDANTGADAGDTFETAAFVTPRGPYQGRLESARGDTDDFFRFPLAEGESLSINIGLYGVDVATLLDPNGVPLDASEGTASASSAFTGELDVRLAVHRAVVAGEYRLRLYAGDALEATYSLCFMNCETPMTAPIEFIFGGSLPTPDTRVLLVPPSHGDLGNPLGPTVLDYLDATLRGVRRWTVALDRFATDYPEYSYLREIDVSIEIFDGADPIDPAGYDVIIGYVAAGPVFRGVATDGDSNVEEILDELGLKDAARFSGRVIALSLFGSSPRAGQVAYDFPEVNDLENVTMHEFGHTFGLGHTQTWHETLGPDLMNSPAAFVYGDGFPFGDGHERTQLDCLTSLDLYGMAELYRWIPEGGWQPSYGETDLPAGMPYVDYC